MKSTKEQIIDAAIVVFNEDLSASLEKVAGRSGKTRRTLHRYFTDRDDLFNSCHQNMQETCGRAMTAAMDSSSDLLKQLEQVVYAGVDCGVKFAFLDKLHHVSDHVHQDNNKGCEAYDMMIHRFRDLLKELQQKEMISGSVTVEWTAIFLSGIISSTIAARTTGAVAVNQIKQFAWFSFSKGVGL